MAYHHDEDEKEKTQVPEEAVEEALLDEDEDEGPLGSAVDLDEYERE